MATFFLLFPLLIVIAPIQSSSLQTTPQINVWPKPTFVSWPNPTANPLSPSFRILPSCHDHPYLRRAVARYNHLVLTERHCPILPPLLNFSSSSLPLLSLSLSVADFSSPLRHGVDESYSLSISASASSANLSAATPWGAMRGLETFSQLVYGDPPFVPVGIDIYDFPLFPHRGVLLDTSRNFYPVGDILRTIRAMSHNKLNVFHWHITDSQSFPLLLPSEPDLALKGSYGPAFLYSPADIRRVVDYASSHGVRVVPEIDAPGHTASWAKAYPEIVTCANKFWAPAGGEQLAAEPGTGQLNPLNPKSYRVVRNVLRDVAELFPESFFHAGGDEVNTACWENDPTVKSFIAAGGTHDELLELFINATRPLVTSLLNRTVVYWEDVLLGPNVKVDATALPPETTVLQTWNNGPANTKRLASAGYRVVVSSWEFYYLDCGHGGWVGNDSRYDRQEDDEPGVPFNGPGGNGGSWCAPFKSWQRVYDYDILHGLSEEEAGMVIGGEVALWSEQTDETVVDGKLWPRAAAMAETMWSGNRDENGRKRYAQATDRLNEWRHRMVGRGIRAEPIQPLWCAMNPGMCNLV